MRSARSKSSTHRHQKQKKKKEEEEEKEKQPSHSARWRSDEMVLSWGGTVSIDEDDRDRIIFNYIKRIWMENPIFLFILCQHGHVQKIY